MRNNKKEKGRVRPVLLVLLWIWAVCVFVALDLFLNVTEFDRVRPDSRLYRAMRYAAHEMIGEPYHEGDFLAELPGRATPRPGGSAGDRLAALPYSRRMQLLEDLGRSVRAEGPLSGRITAMRALAAAFGSEARPLLLDVVRDARTGRPTRAEAARALGRTGGDALATLVALLAADLPDRVKAGAVLGLVEVGTEEAAQRASALSEREPSLVQVAAVRALARFDRAECVPALASKATDGSAAKEARVAACRGLGRAGAVDELQKILHDAEAPLPVRMAAVQALETIDEPDALTALQTAAGVASPVVARRAAVARTRLAARKTN